MTKLINLFAGIFVLSACATLNAPLIDPVQMYDTARFEPQPYVKLKHPDWAKDAVIYQINTRQFTPEGTFRAAQEQLPRLRNMGVDILWIMPVHPIGETNRKGTLGSPYSVKDYYGINPEFGTKADFKALIDAAHAQGFHVILDWVANHSAWDNKLTADHPDWYHLDWKGDNHPTPWTDWADIIDFDYNQPGLREYMTGALRYWVEEMDVDGFRCDVAGFVPLDFWETARAELDRVKPVFMLAEWEQRDLHALAFDATYGWKWKETAQRIAAGEADAGAMTGYLNDHISTWPHDGYRLLYTENHDQNAWEGTTGGLYGEAYRVLMTLSFVIEGIPMIHNGQEVANQDQLEFFEKDPIIWGETNHPDGALIKSLIAMRKQNKALHNGNAGGRIIPVVTTSGGQVVSFARQSGDNKVVALFNLSPGTTYTAIIDGPVDGTYTNALTGQTRVLKLGDYVALAPWSSLILIQNTDSIAEPSL